MVIAMVAGVLVPGYSSLSQHISELGLIDHPAAAVMPIAALLTGASILLFGVGILLHTSRAFTFTALAAIIFGVSFASAGIFPTGTGLHGLYGLTMFYVLVPACFAAEMPVALRVRWFVTLSLLAAVIPLTYMWALLSGLEPSATRGLTQRLASLVIFGWYPFASIVLRRADRMPTSESGTAFGAQPAVS